MEGKQVHIHLPAAQVFSTRLDSAKTRVYSRQTGLLVPTDPDLETQVRQEAERQLLAAALADGILQHSPAERDFDYHQPAAGFGIREDRPGLETTEGTEKDSLPCPLCPPWLKDLTIGRLLSAQN